VRYLSISEILLIHRRVIGSSGGATEIRDLGALESAIAQPRATFDGNDLYSTIEEKIILQLAAGKIDRTTFTYWVNQHVTMRHN